MTSMLTRPTYSLSEASRLLRVSPSKLRWWLEGAVRGPRRYPSVLRNPSVLRSEPTGSSQVSWGEFIEAAYLREYLQHLPLQRLRPAKGSPEPRVRYTVSVCGLQASDSGPRSRF